MFKRLQQKWQVNLPRLVLILITFSIGGSMCGYLGRKLLVATIPDLPATNGWWWVLYFIVVTLIWPICVMVISIPLGQFTFFKTYLGRMARRMGFGKKGVVAKEKETAKDAA